jgi:hypothetical protein
VAGDAACEQRMLERQKDAHVARGRIERADEGDDEQWPEVVESSETEAGQDHEQGSGDQQRARVAPDGGEPDSQGQQSRAEQRGRGQHAHTDGIEAEQQQIGRQDNADEPVARGPQPAGGKEQPGLGRGARRQQLHHHASNHP